MNTIMVMEEISRKLVIAFKEINDICRTSIMIESSRAIPVQPPQQQQPSNQKQFNGNKHSKQPPKEVIETKPAQRIEEIVVESKKEKKTHKKAKKVEQDPLLPKRPMGSYIMFQKDRKSQIIEANPYLSLPELSKLLGKEWQKLDADIKNSYQNKFKQAKNKYDKDMEEYIKKHPDYEEPKRKKKVVDKQESSEIKSNSSDMPIKFNVKSQIGDEDSLGEVM